MFSSYFLYRFSFWFNWNENSYTITVVSIFTTFVLLGTFFYCLLEGVGTPAAGMKVFVWLVSPDGGLQETTPGGRLVGFVMSFGGLMIFAFVISAVHTGFDEWLQKFRDGLDPVVETDHIVILGNNDALILLIDELCKAYALTGGQSIVVLCETPKQDVEDSIMASGLDHRNSKIVVRTGTATDVQDLEIASVATCSKVVLLPDLEKEPEYRDACAFQVLYALRGQGWPLQGTVLVVCSLMRNEALLRELGGTAAQVLLLGAFVAKLMTLSSRGWGLGEAMHEMLSNSGDNFHVCQVPKSLIGVTFLDASMRFPDAVLVGVAEEVPSGLMRQGVAVTVLYDFLSDNCGAPELLKRGVNGTVLSVSVDEVACVAFASHRNSQEVKKSSWSKLRVQGFVPDAGISLCPDPHRKLGHGDALVLLASSDESANDVCPPATSEPSSPQSARPQRGTPCSRGSNASATTIVTPFSQNFRSPEGEVILFLGFNEWIGLILLQLDSMVQFGSHVIIFDSQSKVDREGEFEKMHRDWDSSFTNIRVTHVEGTLACHYELEDLLGKPIEEDRPELVHDVKRVFVLLPKAHALNVAGACVLTMAAQVRATMLDHGVSNVPVIPQVSNLQTRLACEGAAMWDCVSTSELEAKLLAMHVSNPVLGRLMRQLTSDDDASFMICRLDDDYAAISFHQMSHIVMLRRMVLLGWTAQTDGLDRARMILNPPNKHKVRRWRSRRDRLLVLSREIEETDEDCTGGRHSSGKRMTIVV
jgi:hypothetical protein